MLRRARTGHSPCSVILRSTDLRATLIGPSQPNDDRGGPSHRWRRAFLAATTGDPAEAAATTDALEHAAQARRAAGIYGTVVTAAVLASAGAYLRTLPLAAAVLFTLVVYWLAEEYAQIGAAATARRPPPPQGIRST